MRFVPHPIALCMVLLVAPAMARAEVAQSLEVKTYSVPYRADMSLKQAINNASPIRHGGKVFHGFTRWNVNWQIWWLEAPNRQCTVQRSLTRLTAVITLPLLSGAPSPVNQSFETYAAALKEHEMGHYRLGLDAAHRIDRALLTLTPQPTCALLQSNANQTGRRLLTEAMRAEADYDRTTQFGRTQGAWLER